MASGQFVDPQTLLRVAPLITSTASLVIAGDSHLFLSSFISLAPQRPQQVAELAPRYFEAFFWRGLPAIFASYGPSVALGATNAWHYYSRTSPGPSPASWAWYAGGTALALAHYAFVPKIMWKVKDAIDAKDVKEIDGVQAIRGWLDVHHVRMALVDIPAWTCFLIATLKSLKSI
ncbi:hypothetical protein F4820DRAFT_429904 [Hypoxylon rubiginosum]|uniref:Uncharacterized protein n=1 Tax=Hypoxylon rubiginosum TaxID=110542 RepID=A0ACB9YTZ4_9PEZI|nr:hypothetical protein F4820DRAFT_429904 [Hypoxylon rubiginosum]